MQNASITVLVATAEMSASRRRMRGRRLLLGRRAALRAGASGLVWLFISDARGIDEAHADPVYRPQVPGGGGGFAELAAQPGQVNIDGVFRAPVGLIPDFDQQLALGHHPSAPRGEQMQQVELFAAEAQVAPTERGLPGRWVDVQLTHDYRGIDALWPGAAQHRAQACLHLVSGKRLDNVVVSPSV